MKKVIYRYVLKVGGITVLELPKDRQFLDFAFRDGDPSVWFWLDPESPTETVEFMTTGTGIDMEREVPDYVDSQWEYRGTDQFDMPGGLFVLHVFEKRKYVALT